MLARIAALQGRWEDVITFTDRVTNSEANYQLVDDYGSNFDGSGNNNAESIFEIQYTLTNTSLNVWSEAGDWNSNGISKYASPQVDNAGWAFMSPAENLVQDYESGDLRLARHRVPRGRSVRPGNLRPGSEQPPGQRGAVRPEEVYQPGPGRGQRQRLRHQLEDSFATARFCCCAPRLKTS